MPAPENVTHGSHGLGIEGAIDALVATTPLTEDQASAALGAAARAGIPATEAYRLIATLARAGLMGDSAGSAVSALLHPQDAPSEAP
jgi:hypothetical protein